MWEVGKGVCVCVIGGGVGGGAGVVRASITRRWTKGEIITSRMKPAFNSATLNFGTHVSVVFNFYFKFFINPIIQSSPSLYPGCEI